MVVDFENLTQQKSLIENFFTSISEVTNCQQFLFWQNVALYLDLIHEIEL